MGNEKRLPSCAWFYEEFGGDFITDTYSTIRDSDGYEKAFKKSLKEMRESSPPEYEVHYDSWQKNANPGSVIAQYLEMFWAMHRDDFWGWRVEHDQ